MTTWVLLRGLTREQGHWGRFPAQLATALAGTQPDLRVVAVDLPGAGVLWRQRCPLQVAAMVPACRAQLQALGLAPPYRLLGLSLGGMVAAAWALAQADEVAACVMVNTSLRPFSPPQQRLQLRHGPRLLRLLAPRDPRQAEATILQLTSAQPQRHAAVLADWVAIRQARPVSAANALRQLWAAARYRQPSPPPGLPVLVASSAGDRLVDPRCSWRLAAAWGCTLALHPDAGHDLPLDDGPWLARQVADWAATVHA